MTQQQAALGPLGKAALIGAGVMSGAGNSTLSAILPQIEAEFGTVSDGMTVTTAFTVFGLGMLFGSLIGGWACDRFGRRVVMVVSGLLFGVAGCSVMLADSLLHVVIGRLLTGTCTGAAMVAAYAAIGDSWDEKGRNLWTGLVTAFGSLAGIALAVVAAALADVGWRLSFGIYAVGFIAAICAAFGVAAMVRKTNRVTAAPLAIALVVLFLALGFGVGAITTGTAAYLPYRFVEEGVATATGRALYGVPGGLAVVVTSLGYGLLRRWLSLGAAFSAGALLSAGGLAGMALGASPALLSAGLAVTGAGMGLIVPSLMIFAISRATEQTRGAAVGLARGAMFGGPFAIQFALDPLRAAEGAGAPLLAIAAIALVLAAWFPVRALTTRTAAA